MSEITIKDLARKLGISASTVSRALRNHPDISKATKEQIQSLAKELGYQPNTIAQSLKSKRSNVIGMIVPQVKHHFFATVMSGITDVADSAGFTVMLCQSNDDYEREVINLQTLTSQRVAGLLVSVSQNTENYDHFEQLRKNNIPLVFFDRVCEDCSASKVIVDDYDGAFQATNHLIERGYKNIAHLSGPEHLNITQKRLQGFLDAHKKAGLTCDKQNIVYGGLNEEHGAPSYFKLLEQMESRPDALFCITDPVAIGVYTHLKKEKIKIPDEIALVGFTDNPTVSLIEPPLTTVRQPAYEMGKVATELLIKQINSKELDDQKITLKTRLIIRQSS